MAKSFLISFPKVGRTWLRLMMGRTFTYHFGIDDMERDLFNNEKLHGRDNRIPRIVEEHEDRPQKKKPNQLRENKNKFKNSKVIFLVRDPRDVVVSFYFMRTRRKKNVYKGSIKQFIRDNTGSLASMIKYYNIWYNCRKQPKDFLLITYEELKKNGPETLSKIMQFFNIDVKSDVIKKAYNFCVFEKMRQYEKANTFKIDLRPADPKDQESYMTRKGKVGGYREYLDEEDIQYINEQLEKLDDFYNFYKVNINDKR